jgi:hypothetical protein
MTEPNDATVEAARKLLRELGDAMKSPRGDYYQGDIADPHRALHIVAKHIAAYTEAALKEWKQGNEMWFNEAKKANAEVVRLEAALAGKEGIGGLAFQQVVIADLRARLVDHDRALAEGAALNFQAAKKMEELKKEIWRLTHQTLRREPPDSWNDERRQDGR